MQPIYEEDFLIRSSHTDAFGVLRPSTLLGLMQEVAGSHYDLSSPDYVWVVSRHHVEIRRLPGAGERVRMETWALPATRAAFPRATICRDASGAELFRGISLWVLVGRQSHAMVLPKNANLPMVTTLRGLELPTPGSLAPGAYGSHCTRKVRYSLLDVNGHMNNARYLDWMDDLLPLEFHREHDLREFTICYLTEGKADMSVDIGYEMDGGILRADGFADGTRIFAAKLSYDGKNCP